MAEKEKSRKQNPIQAYFRETAGELRKVSWPSRREVTQLTWIVLAVMVVMGIILGLTDGGARELLNLVLGF
ncbi:MAG: preprotein translocase subunit SecE [Anaerolineales bacterium]